MADSPAVLVERDSADPAVAVVTMNRPERHNALTVELKVALRDALVSVAGDDSVGVIVLTGSGRSFCVGQDLGEHAAALAEGAEFTTVEEHYNPIVLAMAEAPKPVIAAINGTCVGAGLGFALAADLRVTAAGATFATAFTGIGLTADSGLSATLAHMVGVARATELIAHCRSRISAARIKVDQVVAGLTPPSDDDAGTGPDAETSEEDGGD